MVVREAREGRLARRVGDAADDLLSIPVTKYGDLALEFRSIAKTGDGMPVTVSAIATPVRVGRSAQRASVVETLCEFQQVQSMHQ